MKTASKFELIPSDGRKSFYGKAIVSIDENGNKTLYSYGTKIITVFKNGEAKRYWDYYTQTTGRHIRSFCGLSKKEYFALEYENNQY